MKTKMKVKNISLTRATRTDSKVRAFGAVTIAEDDGDFEMTIYNIRVIDGRNGMFVGWPSRKVNDKYIDVIMMTEDYKNALSERIVKIFESGDVKDPQQRDSYGPDRNNTSAPAPAPTSAPAPAPAPAPEPAPTPEPAASTSDDDIFG